MFGDRRIEGFVDESEERLLRQVHLRIDLLEQSEMLYKLLREGRHRISKVCNCGEDVDRLVLTSGAVQRVSRQGSLEGGAGPLWVRPSLPYGLRTSS